VTDIRYLAIWAPRFTSNYGDVYIPPDVQVPRPLVKIVQKINLMENLRLFFM